MISLPCYGMDRRHLDRIFLRLGGKIAAVRGTGETMYFHPILGRPARANSRRKDAPRHLVAYVREVIRRLPAASVDTPKP